MQSNIIDRLFSSFEELDTAIRSARKTLGSREYVPSNILQRLDSYDGILSKQKRLASQLCGFINEGNWDEVTRHVSLINGLSAMIRDDARAILGAISNDSSKCVEEELNIC